MESQLTEPDLLLEQAVRCRLCTDAAAAVFDKDDVRFWFAGERSSPDAYWDIASLTKIVTTTVAAMRATHAGHLNLEHKVCEILPERVPSGDAAVLDLLRHTAGLPPSPVWDPSVADQLLVCKPLQANADRLYSCFSFLLLQCALEKTCDRSLRDLATEAWAELGIAGISWTADGLDCVISARSSGDPTVHDPSAERLGGAAANAGTFAQIGAVAEIGRWFLNSHLSGGDASPEFGSLVQPWASGRIGFDRHDGRATIGERWSPETFGHYGFTGCSLWIDPVAERGAVLLTNRTALRPNTFTEIDSLRTDWHEIAARVGDSLSSPVR